MRGRYLEMKLTLLGFLFVATLQAQVSDSLRFRQAFPALANFVTSDNLSNTYLISSNNAIVKYDSLSKQVAVFSNKRLGAATFLDASNPLKILVWYPDFQTLLWLDRTLNEMGRLEFSKLELYAVRCVAMAFDGNIWAFDDALSKALKLSPEGELLFESQPLNRYFPKRFSATRFRDSGQFVCLNDPANGFCLLDQYANIVETYSTFRISDFETEGSWMYYLDKEALQLQNLGRLEAFQIQVPSNIRADLEQTWLGKHCVYWQNGERLEMYAWD